MLEINSQWLNSAFPATTSEVAISFDLPVSSTSDFLEKLRRRKKLKSRFFTWFKGKRIKLYIHSSQNWPSFLFYTCGQCENWNRFTLRCTFLQELASKGFRVDQTRLRHAIISPLVACKWFLPRTLRGLRTYASLEEFAKKSADKELWWQTAERDRYYLSSPSTAQIGYRCVHCKRPMPVFGWGFSPLVGSSISVCDWCGGLYKLVFSKENDAFTVVTSKELFHEYSLRYFLYTGGAKPDAPKSFGGYGLSLVDIHPKEDLHDDVEALTNKNLFAYYNQLNYLAVRTIEEYEGLLRRLEKDYQNIEILLATEPTRSVQPTKQQQGAVALFRFEGSLNYWYAKELLWGRVNAIEELEEFVGNRLVMEKQEKLLGLLQQLHQWEKSKQQLSVDQWNQLDGRGAKVL